MFFFLVHQIKCNSISIFIMQITEIKLFSVCFGSILQKQIILYIFPIPSTTTKQASKQTNQQTKILDFMTSKTVWYVKGQGILGQNFKVLTGEINMDAYKQQIAVYLFTPVSQQVPFEVQQILQESTFHRLMSFHYRTILEICRCRYY